MLTGWENNQKKNTFKSPVSAQPVPLPADPHRDLSVDTALALAVQEGIKSKEQTTFFTGGNSKHDLSSSGLFQ